MSDANSWRRGLVTDQQEETIIICQPVYIHIPVYDERDVSKDTVLVDETQCQDFSMNVNMEISKNKFIRKCLYYDELKTRTTVAVWTILAILFVWFITHLVDGFLDQLSNLPNLILILSLYLASAIVGQTLSAVSHIPPFVGMILVGMAFQNSGVDIKIGGGENGSFWLFLSEFTESVILIIGALELDVWKLHRMGFTVFKLAILPQIAEIVALSAIALNYTCRNSNKIKLTHMFLFKMSSINCILFMPSISVFKRFCYFNENNVYTVLYAASNIVNIVAMIINYITYSKYPISGYFSIHQFGFILPSSSLKKTFIDIMFGILWGIFLIYISPPDCLMVNNDLQQEEVNDHEVNNKQISNLLTTTKRVVLLLAGGILTSTINLYYVTAWYFSLSCGISSFIAGIGWKWKMREINNKSTISLNNDNTEDQNQICDILKVFKYILNALQPLFFGCIGTGFHFQYVNVNKILITSVIIVFIRILITAFSFWRSGFNCYKLIFIVITWLQNSTTMAVLAPLYLGIIQVNCECFHFDEELFNVTVIFNMMTATLGTFFVRRYGPKLLSDEINDHVDV